MPFNGSVCAITKKTPLLMDDYLDAVECYFGYRIIVTMMKFEVIRGSTELPSAPPIVNQEPFIKVLLYIDQCLKI